MSWLINISSTLITGRMYFLNFWHPVSQRFLVRVSGSSFLGCNFSFPCFQKLAAADNVFCSFERKQNAFVTETYGDQDF